MIVSNKAPIYEVGITIEEAHAVLHHLNKIKLADCNTPAEALELCMVRQRLILLIKDAPCQNV